MFEWVLGGDSICPRVTICEKFPQGRETEGAWEWMECLRKMHGQETKLRTETGVCGSDGGDGSRRWLNGIQGEEKPIPKNK